MRLPGPGFPQRVSAAEVQQEGPQEVVDPSCPCAAPLQRPGVLRQLSRQSGRTTTAHPSPRPPCRPPCHASTCQDTPACRENQLAAYGTHDPALVGAGHRTTGHAESGNASRAVAMLSSLRRSAGAAPLRASSLEDRPLRGPERPSERGVRPDNITSRSAFGWSRSTGGRLPRRGPRPCEAASTSAIHWRSSTGKGSFLRNRLSAISFTESHACLLLADSSISPWRNSSRPRLGRTFAKTRSRVSAGSSSNSG